LSQGILWFGSLNLEKLDLLWISDLGPPLDSRAQPKAIVMSAEQRDMQTCHGVVGVRGPSMRETLALDPIEIKRK